MALTLVLGPANSAKAGEVLGAYAAAARRGALLVVPTASDAEHYARELAGEDVVLGSVLTFGGLVAELGRRAPYAGRRLSDLQRERLLERTLAGMRFDALQASTGASGFVEAAAALIAELQRELISPQRFTVALRAWAAQDVRRATFARDVGRIYGEYVRALDRLGRVDRELFAWRALDALRASPGRWGRDPVFFYGFDDLTALERDAVETLARVVGVDVTVSLTYEPGREALIARAEAVEALRPLAERVLELPAQAEHYAPGARAALHHLERWLFASGAPRVASGAAIELLEAGGERAEAELVAERVCALLRAGVPGDEIAVVHRSRRRSAALLARVFSQYGVPLSAGQEVSLGHTALGRAVLGAARCAWLGADARAEDLLDFLRAPGRLERPEIADGLEADVRRGGLRTAAQARAQLGWELGELYALAAAAEPAAATEPAAALCALARRLFAAPHRARAPQLTAAEEVDARALATLARAVAELDELAPALPRPSPPELIELLARLPVAVAGAPGPGEVLLAEPLEVRARRFRVVFVCGLQEGEFPAPARPEPFLSDERRRELAVASGLALRPREDALAAERYLFYSAVSRATERVFLAYRSSDEEGNLALPSPFIADVAELLEPAWRERRARRLLADVVWDPALAPTERERARALAAARAPLTGEEPAPRRLLGPRALAGMRHTRILSAGALETYGDCPVRWLVERELSPAPLAPDPDPIIRGNLIHGVLERLLRALGGPITPATLPAAHAALDQLLSELAASPEPMPGAGRPEVVRAAALREIAADLRRYLDHEAATGPLEGWRSYGLELRFGFEDSPGSLPALALGDDADPVLVRGMIDRVDVDADGHAVVRDYKSGAGRPDQPAARWSADQRLQVALYMLVVRELAGLTPVAGFYQPLRGENVRARGVFLEGAAVGSGVVATDARQPAQLDALLADAAARAVALAGALRSGELTPCPQSCSRDGCAFPGICRSQ
ncbi:MAG: PD-(D/E)XK nuclease family protein [Solirubrobacteraceae bacterium]